MTRRTSRRRTSLRRNSSRRYEYRVTPGSGGPSTNVLGWSLADAKKFAAHAVRAGQMEAHIERALRYPGGHRGEWSHVMTAYKKLAKNSRAGVVRARALGHRKPEPHARRVHPKYHYVAVVGTLEASWYGGDDREARRKLAAILGPMWDRHRTKNPRGSIAQHIDDETPLAQLGRWPVNSAGVVMSSGRIVMLEKFPLTAASRAEFRRLYRPRKKA